MTIPPTRSPIRRVAIAPVLAVASTLAAVGLISACANSPDRGYAFGGTLDPSVRTVAVVIFENDTLHTGFETTLSEAIIKRFQQHTAWRVTDADTADAVLRGSVEQIRLIAISTRVGPGLVQEQGVRVTVDFELLDNRRGGTVLQREDFTSLASFIPAQPTQERISVGYRNAAETLAIDIVDELGNTW